MRIWLVLLPAAVVAAIVALSLLLKRHNKRWVAAALSIVLGIAAYGSWLAAPKTVDLLTEPVVVKVAPGVPTHGADGEFITSTTCVECHPKQHDSWHKSFHRTMTQVVSPETFLASLDKSIELESRGRSYRLWRDGDDFMINMIDPDWDAIMRAQGTEGMHESDAPRVDRKIVMSTGSHHYQTYWVNSAFGNELRQIPWVWHLAEERWLPAEDAFITPPNGPRRLETWNDSCIQCHAVHGQPGLDSESGIFSSRVSEFGISCEACHGPAKEHVQFYRNNRDETALDGMNDSVVNPAKLTSNRSSQVCGQCHSYFSFTEDEGFLQTGFKYRAGDDLHATRIVHEYDSAYVQSRPDLMAGYWNDGTMRLAGREFSAMDDSACYLNGDMSCLSCHSMHDYESTNDLLKPGGLDAESCLQCHESYRDRLEEHTHHASDSTGSNCINCHMPHTSFGLLKAIRSHRVDSPTAAMTAEHGRPNACNLCHIDQTLQWTADHLKQWYEQPAIALDGDNQEIASSLLLALRGDAAQRAVSTWHLGWEPSKAASIEGGWQVPFLALQLVDPYAGVRFVAYRSLRTYPGFADFEYDYLATHDERAAAMRLAIEKWRATIPENVGWDPNTLMLRADGTVRIEAVQKLMNQRDNRPIELPE